MGDLHYGCADLPGLAHTAACLHPTEAATPRVFVVRYSPNSTHSMSSHFDPTEAVAYARRRATSEHHPDAVAVCTPARHEAQAGLPPSASTGSEPKVVYLARPSGDAWVRGCPGVLWVEDPGYLYGGSAWLLTQLAGVGVPMQGELGNDYLARTSQFRWAWTGPDATTPQTGFFLACEYSKNHDEAHCFARIGDVTWTWDWRTYLNANPATITAPAAV